MPQQNAIIKTAVHMIVAGYAQKTAKTVIVENTNTNPDSILLSAGTFLAGETVASMSDPYTSKIVDASVSKIKSLFSKKNNPESE